MLHGTSSAVIAKLSVLPGGTIITLGHLGGLLCARDGLLLKACA